VAQALKDARMELVRGKTLADVMDRARPRRPEHTPEPVPDAGSQARPSVA
jgi:hypothetical protein